MPTSPLQNLDPAVMAALTRSQRIESEAAQPRDVRAKQAKARAKVQARNRFVVDMDPDLQQRLEALAAKLSCPASGLVNLAIAMMLEKKIDYRDYLKPTRSPRYEYSVVISKDGQS